MIRLVSVVDEIEVWEVRDDQYVNSLHTYRRYNLRGGDVFMEFVWCFGVKRMGPIMSEYLENQRNGYLTAHLKWERL